MKVFVLQKHVPYEFDEILSINTTVDLAEESFNTEIKKDSAEFTYQEWEWVERYKHFETKAINGFSTTYYTITEWNVNTNEEEYEGRSVWSCKCGNPSDLYSGESFPMCGETFK